MAMTVLVVDDSKTMRDLLHVALGSEGFTVHAAEDGVEGVEAAGKVMPNVIITDINMPRLDGFGLIASVRSQDSLSRTPILVLTTESAPELKDRARKAGATGWIVKPFDQTKLIAAVRRVAS